MALSTYNELKTSIANWADRDDLTNFIPDFIALTEARFNRALRLRSMEQKEFATTIGGQSNYSLPVNYLQMREFRLNNNPTVSLTYVSPEIFEAWNLGSGVPKFYTIIRRWIEQEPIRVCYSGSSTYRWYCSIQLLVNAPALYGSLLVEPFIQNDARPQRTYISIQQAILTMLVSRLHR